MSDSTITRLPSYKPAYNPEESLQLRNGFQYRKINGRTEIAPRSIPVDMLDREICVLQNMNVEVTNGVRELIQFDPEGLFTAIYDPRRMFTNRDANNDKIYAVNPTNGFYKVSATIQWETANLGTYRIAVLTNQTSTSTGSGYYARAADAISSPGMLTQYVEWYGNMSDSNGDFISLGLEHDYSSPLDALYVTFVVERIG